MKVRFVDAETYITSAIPYLERDPVRCSVSLTVADGIRRKLYDTFVVSVIEDDAGNVIGTASWTPPYQLLVSRIAATNPAEMAKAAELVAARWAEKFGRELTAVIAPREVAEVCGPRFGALTNRTTKLHMAERLFASSKVIDPKTTPTGSAARVAVLSDAPVIAPWFDAFCDEARIVRLGDPMREVMNRIASGRLYVWDTGDRIVSLCGHSFSVAKVSRVGPVYTPPEERGRGYARALVAFVTQTRLVAGDVSCCLFTDLSNPVSNAIYQEVGYRPVGDYAHIDMIA